MEVTIFRSVDFSDQTKWSHPLKAVELVTDENAFQILIYDVGFEPPYYDVTNLPNILFLGRVDEIRKPYTPDNLTPLLESRGIYPREWKVVPFLLLHECNALIRPDIRSDIREVFGFHDKLPEPIPAQVAVDAIGALSSFNGHSALLGLKFLEKVHDEDNHAFAFMSFKQPTKDALRSFTGYFYLMFRRPNQYPHWGFVAKGNPDNIAIQVSCEEEFSCLLYDQTERRNLMRGRITELRVSLTTSPEQFVISPQGLTKIRRT